MYQELKPRIGRVVRYSSMVVPKAPTSMGSGASRAGSLHHRNAQPRLSSQW